MHEAALVSSEKANWLLDSVPALSQAVEADARQRQDSLTKPPGSLGRLEEIARRFSVWQSTDKPRVSKVQVTIFAGDHGVARSGLSAYPQQVTLEMIRNFSRGGAAINVLARQIGADFSIVNLGTIQPCENLDGVINLQLAPGTRSFLEEPAMTTQLCLDAINAGAERIPLSADLFVGGEMGIGNTSSATALICALTGEAAEKFVGRGTGLDDAGIRRKSRLIQQALDKNPAGSPLGSLAYFGGLEIAALVGAYIACAQKGIPILVDGFICTAAALVAVRINPDCRNWMLFSHRSDEQGHGLLLELLDADPLIDFSLRLGEGTGAALTVPLIQSACLLQSEMATFEQAQVSR